MGESIAEGTIVRWIKKVGDTVDRDEPLFEISTDKVDAEIPSPAAGTLLEIAVKEGETVPVNSVVAQIGAAGEGVARDTGDTGDIGGKGAAGAGAAGAGGAGGGDLGGKGAVSADATGAASAPTGKTAPAAAQGDGTPAARSASAAPGAPETPAAPAAPTSPVPPVPPGVDDLRRQKSSPLVRRIAQEHGVDIRHIAGSGIAGRVTKQDILSYIESPPAAPSTPAPPAAPVTAKPPAPPAGFVMPGDEVVPMSVMRRKIAEHMVLSQRTSAHVYSVFEVNYSRVDQIRKAKKAEFEQRGVKLTFTSFIAKVAVDCLRRHKTINASLDGDNVVYRRETNLGIAVALEAGLIVPVVKRADEMNILGLSRAIADVADRARAKKLNPDEVHGGTFTITNPGNFGAQFGLPIINQPQVAILGVGTIEKRPVVIDDMIGIRLMGFLTLGYDHRLVDGAVADQFMADLKKGIEQFDPSQV
jgi:2-oxoglutarate dehydrogenase E2 component (dihydrolipoamide succinyltransferase)